ncbi:nucleoside 2-deoxyribosyltransferase [Gudongella sp. DL1XJH-153]|uniref:nucleoside 2-deoxyribosyltransferase n=1 Tax=Gudongella sp. DL1XJH-153 TaxID=3409804 RepID=UPI003BB74094
MKAYIAVKYHKDRRNKDIVDSLEAIIERKGFETVSIVGNDYRGTNEFANSYDLMKVTFGKIDECDLLIIDLSEKGVGLGIEAGYAYAKDIPVITIAKQGSDISETMEGISRKTIFYNRIEDLEYKLQDILKVGRP